MSVLIQYPNGQQVVVSDAVAEILSKREGHKLIRDVKESEKKPEVKSK